MISCRRLGPRQRARGMFDVHWNGCRILSSGRPGLRGGASGLGGIRPSQSAFRRRTGWQVVFALLFVDMHIGSMGQQS